MKRLHFPIPSNLSLLHEEILDAIPTVAPVMNVTNGQLEAVMRVEGNDNNVWLTVPDDVDEAAIAVVVQAHDATRKQQDPRRGRQIRLTELLSIPRSSWTATQRAELLQLVARDIAT